MINVKESTPGDCCYFLVSWQSKPIFGEVVRVIEDENAVQVLTPSVGFRIVRDVNAFWDEKSAKKGKYVAVKYNYIKHTVENDDGRTEHNAGVGDVHNGQERLSKDDGKEKPTRSVQKSPKRKQKTVRSSGKSKDKTGTGRKPRRTKNKSS